MSRDLEPELKEPAAVEVGVLILFPVLLKVGCNLGIRV